MTAICKERRCNESVLLLPLQVDTTIDDNSFALLMGYTVDSEYTEYHISKGVEYIVYGILIYRNQIRYLIQDDDGMPIFCPEELLLIQNRSVYWDWEVLSFFLEGMPLVLIGYPAMEGAYDKLIDLVERREKAIKRFLQYKDYAKTHGDFWN